MVLVQRRFARSASCLVISLMSLVVTSHGPATAAPIDEPSGPSYRAASSGRLQSQEDHFASRVVVLINQKRVSHGLRKVTSNACVFGYANRWATHMQKQNKFEHSNLMNLIKRCDAPFVSENIAQVTGHVTPRQLVSLWMHSPDHRHNILSKKPTATGVGIRWDPDQQLWVAVQNFAKKPGSFKN